MLGGESRSPWDLALRVSCEARMGMHGVPLRELEEVLGDLWGPRSGTVTESGNLVS